MQKRGGFFPSTGAQITIFLVLGIVLLFVFLFLVVLTSRLTLHPLEESQEEIFSKVFRKEAMRIFVEDCLRDELRSALHLLGKQGGRIWDDQEGGTEQFAPGVSGIFDAGSGDRVAYGLTRKEYTSSELEHGNPYPCTSAVHELPTFCKYIYPFSPARFGVVQPWESNIEKDLENYLKIKAQSCIDQYLQEKVPGAKLFSEEYTLTVDLRDDGIVVEAFYPLRFGLEGKDYFTLSTFDFLYPSSLRRFLRAVYIYPLQWDWQFVDFAYEDDVGMLKDASFTVSGGITRTTFKTDYDRLGIALEAGPQLPSGDTLFVATSPFPNIVDTPGEYVFTFARQNRPPALDYVQRDSCIATEEYDYLVVKGADGDLGKIDLWLNAKDPDEEKDVEAPTGEEDLKYFFSGEDISAFKFFLVDNDRNPVSIPTSGEIEARGVLMSKEQIAGNPRATPPILSALPENKIYTLTAKAKDKWGQEDVQEIRILVDNALDPNEAEVKIEFPWGLAVPNSDGKIEISKEDPFLVRVSAPPRPPTTPPSPLPAEGIISSITLAGESVPLSSPTATCQSFPQITGDLNTCDFEEYDINTFPTTFPTSLSGEVSLTTTFSINYCASATNPGTNARSTDTKNLVVKDCIPYANGNNPFPFIPGKNFHEYFLEDDGTKDLGSAGDEQKTEGLLPFAATHTCCVDGSIRTSVSCNGPPNCEDVPTDFSDATPGYILVEHTGTCSRGNICGDGTPASLTVKLNGTKMICGDPDVNLGCGGSVTIAEKCEGQDAWGYVDTDASGSTDAWCHGIMGCGSLCKGNGKEVVYDGSGAISNANTFATSNKAVNDSTVKFHCSCSSGDVYPVKPCDSDFNGVFEGTCKSNGACTAP